ncbi:MAG: hypothetical protein LBK64_08030 [Spirochaetaceae bacterium]|nr:hypothetical protein [Spirochaetaceae bacterium]
MKILKRFPGRALVLLLLVQGSCELYNLPLNGRTEFFPAQVAQGGITNFQQLRNAVLAAPSGGTTVITIETTFNTLSDAPYPAPPIEIENKTIILAAGRTDQSINRERSLIDPFFLVKAGGELVLGKNENAGKLSLRGSPSAGAGFVTVEAGGTLTLNKDAALLDNKSNAAAGGGVKISGTFIMNGGDIRGNQAGSGGGVYIAPGGSFKMSGGTISGNRAARGPGVYMDSNASEFSMADSALIAPDNDVYLRSGSRVTVDRKLTGTFPAAVLTPEMYDVPPPATCLIAAASAPDLASEAPKFAVTQSGGKTYSVNSGGYLSTGGTVRLASSNAEYDSLQTALNNAAQEDTVYILADIIMADASETVDVPGGKNITIVPFGPEKKIVRGGTSPFDSLIRVKPGAVLKLSGGQGNLILDGAGKTAGEALISVQDALLKIENGVTIKNNINTLSGNPLGGGISLFSSSNMLVLAMSGGTITGNKASSGSGIYADNGTVNITGGIIEANESNNPFGDGSIWIDSGELTLGGQAEIRGNKTKGVYINTGKFTMTGGFIKSNDNGGVYVGKAEFLMTQGEISANKTNGVFIDSGTFTMGGDAHIGVQSSGNGVNFSGGAVFSMKENALVESGVKLGGGKYITVTGPLIRPYPAAVITPADYFTNPVLVVLDKVSDTNIFAKFGVTPNNGDYHVDSGGKLAAGPP